MRTHILWAHYWDLEKKLAHSESPSYIHTGCTMEIGFGKCKAWRIHKSIQGMTPARETELYLSFLSSKSNPPLLSLTSWQTTVRQPTPFPLTQLQWITQMLPFKLPSPQLFALCQPTNPVGNPWECTCHSGQESRNWKPWPFSSFQIIQSPVLSSVL